MGDRTKIEEKLRKKIHEIQMLDDKIKTARVYIQALQDVLRLMGSDGDPEEFADSTLRAGSLVTQAREIILRQGSPIHVNDLMEALGKKNTRENRASLTGSLSAYVRKREIFTRPAPNTYGLFELDHQNLPETAQEPPAGFGSIGSASNIRQQSTVARPPIPDEDDDIPF